MSRSLGPVVASLVFGAAAMYVGSNFKLRVEPVGDPPRAEVAPPPPVIQTAAHLAIPQPAPAPEPAPLPASVFRYATAATPRVAVPAFPVVRDAGVLPVQAAGAPAPPQTPKLLEVTETFGPTTLTWKVGRPDEPVELATRSGSISLKFSATVTDQTVETVPEILQVTRVNDTARFTIPDDQIVEYVAKLNTSKVGTLKLPRKSTPEFQLLASSSFPSPYHTNSTPVPTDVSKPIEVYNGYLRLKGSSKLSQPKFMFYQVLSGNGNVPVAVTPSKFVRDASTGVWETELELGILADGTPGSIIVKAETSTGYLYAPPVPIIWKTASELPTYSLPVPTTAGTDASLPVSPSSQEAPVYLIGPGKFRFAQPVSRSSDPRPENIPGLYFLYSVNNGSPEAIAPGSPFEYTPAADGSYRIVVRAGIGNQRPGPESAPITVRRHTVPPKVVLVDAPRFGQGGAGTISVRFETPGLKKPSAAAFALTLKTNTTSAPGTPVTGGVVSLDPDGRTVLIKYARDIVPGVYTLSLPGTNKDDQISDLIGNTIAEPFTQDLTAPTDALASQSAGVTLQTGPNVEFPEYTKFRKVPDGFNPSDRVETRVVRLYYNRDAHRVAQIVNRDVKSYNAATVDVRRRAADRVRDEANMAIDERKRLEREAVIAFEKTREAEKALAEARNKAQTARNESATAGISQTQLQDALDAAKRDLSQAENTAIAKRNNDPVIEEARNAKAGLDAEIKRLSDLEATATGDRLIAIRTDKALRARDAEAALNRINRLTEEVRVREEREVEPKRAAVAELQRQLAGFQQVQRTADTVSARSADEIKALEEKVHALRQVETRADEAAKVQAARELRATEDQFRREVAAAREDPDTYAPGKKDSDDPVRQCSISVVGEGVIQIRGPIKGLNVIRTMINQLDAPAGQVRVGVHTIQVNGERADRMEKVVANIQRYLDHSRFLTTQSTQMLRKAVTLVASRKADEAAAQLPPGCSPNDRDRKYLLAFYGKDFIDELHHLDSEFLRTGNKLLSLHSMDTTSLSAALFQLALAKNTVRQEILTEFRGMIERDLPAAEQNYYLAGLSGAHCEACFDKKFYLLACNARFESLKGYFDAEIVGEDTMSPIQREFVRLAQIFKSRMITEIQIKQRVMERSLLEERIGRDYLAELKKAADYEEMAKTELGAAQIELETAAANSGITISTLLKRFDEIEKQAETADAVFKLIEQKPGKQSMFRGQELDVPKKTSCEIKFGTDEKVKAILGNALRLLEQFWYISPENFDKFKPVRDTLRKAYETGTITIQEHRQMLKLLPDLLTLIGREIETVREKANRLRDLLTGPRQNVGEAIVEYSLLREYILARLRKGFQLRNEAEILMKADAFENLRAAFARAQAADRKAKAARRPLDEKKLLDMLVDEAEDKFIELVEGTRAHTANIDNYLKAISTALDDDLNTQFYNPAFRKVRESSRYWDVTLGQIETTTVLANNRAFAKVSPAATFEFDLPKRDIFITEGFKAAKALMDEYGALTNDPSFLALSKIYSGNPTNALFNTYGAASGVRNVLPGLPTSSDEAILAQAGPGRKEFGSALEALIPDPAIYKFETGTGFEIRPVLSPDGQNVVFNFNYMYSTDVREPVRAGEKHLGRVKRHFVNTDVTLSNYELREVSKYLVSIKAARTGKGVQLLQDIPVAGVLFRPLPSAGASLQQNLIYSQGTIFPTLFDLMGLRYAPAVADLDPLADRNAEFVVRARRRDLEQRIFDVGAARVDEALRIPPGERRPDLYRTQESIPYTHPNGYFGPGLRQKDSHLVEEYDPRLAYPETPYARERDRTENRPVYRTPGAAGDGVFGQPGHGIYGLPRGEGYPGGKFEMVPGTPHGTTVTPGFPSAPSSPDSRGFPLQPGNRPSTVRPPAPLPAPSPSDGGFSPIRTNGSRGP